MSTHEEKSERKLRHDALAKLLEPVRAAFAASGMTEEELDELVETAREERYREAREERRKNLVAKNPWHKHDGVLVNDPTFEKVMDSSDLVTNNTDVFPDSQT